MKFIFSANNSCLDPQVPDMPGVVQPFYINIIIYIKRGVWHKAFRHLCLDQQYNNIQFSSHYFPYFQMIWFRLKCISIPVFFYSPAIRMDTGISFSVPPCVCVSVFVQNSCNFVLQTLPTVLQVYWKFVCKTQFWTIHSLWFKGYLPLNLEKICLVACFCLSASRDIKSHSVTAVVLANIELGLAVFSFKKKTIVIVLVLKIWHTCITISMPLLKITTSNLIKFVSSKKGTYTIRAGYTIRVGSHQCIFAMQLYYNFSPLNFHWKSSTRANH